ncbi:MAG: FHA domain-containing protein [Desulfurococcales archaeon]|nr:FHA domain-containing protein [Desulfurococcales archaeon]
MGADTGRAPRLALSWRSGSEIRYQPLNPGEKYYLGRLHGADVESLRGAWKKGNIYLWTPDYRIVVDTGLSGLYNGVPVVSRRHALLEIVGPRSVRVRDHGPDGRGSKNGTYTCMGSTGRGGSLTIGPGCWLMLSPEGPRFELSLLGEGELYTMLGASGRSRASSGGVKIVDPTARALVILLEARDAVLLARDGRLTMERLQEYLAPLESPIVEAAVRALGPSAVREYENLIVAVKHVGIEYSGLAGLEERLSRLIGFLRSMERG